MTHTTTINPTIQNADVTTLGTEEALGALSSNPNEAHNEHSEQESVIIIITNPEPVGEISIYPALDKSNIKPIGHLFGGVDPEPVDEIVVGVPCPIAIGHLLGESY